MEFVLILTGTTLGIAMVAKLLHCGYRVALYDLIALILAVSTSLEFYWDGTYGIGMFMLFAVMIYGLLMAPKLLWSLFRGRSETTIIILTAQPKDQALHKSARQEAVPARIDRTEIRERIAARYRLENKP